MVAIAVWKMKVVGEGILSSPVRDFAWSPTIDLCVFVMPKEVSSHRLTGQKVWSISSNSLPSPDLEFTHVTWRDDGTVFATGLDDGSIFVWDVQDGRKVWQVMLNSSPHGKISCLNWILEDQKQGEMGSEREKVLDVEFKVEQYLPRVKAIGRNDIINLNDDTSGSGEADGKRQAVDMVFVGSKSGHLELTVFGTFALVTLNTNDFESHKLIIPIHHCTTSDLSLHAIIGRSITSNTLFLNFIKNCTLQAHGKTLRQLTSSSTSINALLAFLTETWTSIVEEYIEVEKVRYDHVSKLSEFLDQGPEDKPEWWTEEYILDYECALLGLLMTGVSEPGVVKWITEKFVTVQNAKKWEKRILDGYDALRNFIHEQVIPLGERIAIVLSRLRGISIWSNHSKSLPLDAKTIEEALVLCDRIFMRTYEILREIVLERSSFEAFSTWLVMMAEDILAHEDANVDPPPLHTIDTRKVAEYISKTFPHPILDKFSSDLTLETGGGEGYFAQVIRLSELMRGYFRSTAQELKEGITWLLPDWIELPFHEDIAASDAQIAVRDGRSKLDIAVALPQRHEVHIHRYDIHDLSIRKDNVVEYIISMNSDRSILRDVLFLDESDLIVIESESGRSANKGYVSRMTYDTHHTFQPGTNANVVDTDINDGLRFPQNGESNFSPVRGACNGREMRNIMCILDADLQRFKMLEIGEDGEIMDEIA